MELINLILNTILIGIFCVSSIIYYRKKIAVSNWFYFCFGTGVAVFIVNLVKYISMFIK